MAFVVPQFPEPVQADWLGTPAPFEAKAPHNVLMTRQWMALVRRLRDGVNGFGVNALGFAGYLPVRNDLIDVGFVSWDLKPFWVKWLVEPVNNGRQMFDHQNKIYFENHQQ